VRLIYKFAPYMNLFVTANLCLIHNIYVIPMLKDTTPINPTHKNNHRVILEYFKIYLHYVDNVRLNFNLGCKFV
jgi:hypothetical protein